MNTATILQLTKSRIGISGTVRDAYLTAIIESIIEELSDVKGIVLDPSNKNQEMFIVDYATWRYQNKDGDKGMPRNLQYRLHDIIIHNGGASDGV